MGHPQVSDVNFRGHNLEDAKWTSRFKCSTFIITTFMSSDYKKLIALCSKNMFYKKLWLREIRVIVKVF